MKKQGKIALLGIDLAKSTFQIHALDEYGHCILKQKMTRKKLVEFVANLSSCIIAMEACASSSYFGRKFRDMEHEIRLIAPQFVKPFVKGNKNDAADAEAICIAASQKSMRFVPVKEVCQQELQSLHRIRSRLVRDRTALMNSIHGIFQEFGLKFPTLTRFRKAVHKYLSEDNDELTSEMKGVLQRLYSEVLRLDEEIKWYEDKLKKTKEKEEEKYNKLCEIQGFGFLCTTAILVELYQYHQFKNGREFAAYIGLTPKHTRTGGKNKVSGIGKQGNQYLRKQLIHGARAALRGIKIKYEAGKELNSLEKWAYKLLLKKGWCKTAVAFAHKNAKIAWSLLAKNEKYTPSKALLIT